MPLGGAVFAVGLLDLRSGHEMTDRGAEAHRAAHLHHVLLLVHHRDDRVRRLAVELDAVRLGQPQNIAREINHGDLHAETKAEVRNLLRARVTRREDFSLHAADTKAARDENAVEAAEILGRAVLLDLLRVDRDQRDAGVVGRAGVRERLVDTLVGRPCSPCTCRRRRSSPCASA